jgi:hypothetical protein
MDIHPVNGGSGRVGLGPDGVGGLAARRVGRRRGHPAGLEAAGEPGRRCREQQQKREPCKHDQRQGNRLGVARREPVRDARPKALVLVGRATVALAVRRARRRDAEAAARTVTPVLMDRGEERSLNVVGSARVALDVRVRVQVLDRLRVARDRIGALDIRMVPEPVVDDALPALAGRLKRRCWCGRRTTDARDEEGKCTGDCRQKHPRRCLCRRHPKWAHARPGARGGLLSLSDRGVLTVWLM